MENTAKQRPRIRQLSVQELTQFEGKYTTIWVAELSGDRVGGAAMQLNDGIPFICDLRAQSEHTEVAAMLIQRIRKDLRSEGYDQLVFTIEQGSPALLPLLLNGKAAITHVVARMSI